MRTGPLQHSWHLLDLPCGVLKNGQPAYNAGYLVIDGWRILND
jgi:hypothetical protein